MQDFFFSSKDYVAKFNNKNILLLVSTQNILSYSQVIWSILLTSKKANSLVNIVLYEEPNSRSTSRGFNRKALRARLFEQAIIRCREIVTLTGGNVEINTINYRFGFKLMNSKRNFFNSKKYNLDDELLRSIHGAWVQKNWKTDTFSIVGPRELFSWYCELNAFAYGKEMVNRFFKDKFYELVLVPNGRYPSQVGIKLEALENNSEVLFYERDNSRTFLQKFQTQDLEVLSEYMVAWLNLMNEKEKIHWKSWASAWLQKQKTDFQQNQFAQENKELFATSKSYEQLLEKNLNLIIPIFTSSVGERYTNLPQLLNGWNSQTAAVLACAKKIKADGFVPHVRLHPNMQWKSLKELAEIVIPLEKAFISYQLPWEGPSSYEILNKSETIITWSSTIALEAMASRKIAYNLDISSHQLISGIKTISPRTLNETNFNSKYDFKLDNTLLATYAYKNFGVNDWGDTAPFFSNFVDSRKVSRFSRSRNTVHMIMALLINPWKSNSRNLIRILVFFFGKSLSRKFLIAILKISKVV